MAHRKAMDVQASSSLAHSTLKSACCRLTVDCLRCRSSWSVHIVVLTLKLYYKLEYRRNLSFPAECDGYDSAFGIRIEEHVILYSSTRPTIPFMTSYLITILNVDMSTVAHLTSILPSQNLRLAPSHLYSYIPAVVFILQSTLLP
jgi:hypothetical protein